MARQNMSLEVKAYEESHPTTSTGDAARVLHASRKTAAKYRPVIQQMASDLQIVDAQGCEIHSFHFNGHLVREFIDKNQNIWFVGMDIRKLFDNTNNLKKILNNDELADGANLHAINVITFGGNKPILVSEFGLCHYSFVSRKPFARKFTAWVTHDVLPSIRKYGAYITPATTEKIISNPEFAICILTALKNEQDKRRAAETWVRKLRPAVRFSDQMQKRHGTITVGEAAAKISSTGCSIIETVLFQYLQNDHLLSRQKGSRWNILTRKALNSHYLVDSIKSYEFPKGSGKYRYYHQPFVTQSGMQRPFNKFCPPILPDWD